MEKPRGNPTNKHTCVCVCVCVCVCECVCVCTLILLGERSGDGCRYSLNKHIINGYNVSDFQKADTKSLVPSFPETLTQGVGLGVGGKLKERGYEYIDNIH